jgi:hypothetical protein
LLGYCPKMGDFQDFTLPRKLNNRFVERNLSVQGGRRAQHAVPANHGSLYRLAS